jgi:hypothetical protein
MLKKEYYCLVAGLPDLVFNQSTNQLSCSNFRDALKYQLSKTDFGLACLLYLEYDNRNLLNLIFKQNEPFNLNGNYNKDFLESEIKKPTEIPDYMFRFLQWEKNMEVHKLNLQTENKLYSFYYDYVVKTKNNFLNEWFRFELNIKNVLTVFNCKRYNYQLEKHLMLTGQNGLLYSMLINKPLKYEVFEEELPFAVQIFQIAESNLSPEGKEKAIDKIKWAYLDEHTFFHYFTIEKIFSYIIKLGIIERWMKLDAKTGKELLNKLIDELKLSYTFPGEFSTVK